MVARNKALSKTALVPCVYRGGVAQVVERVLSMDEAAGSMPATSINLLFPSAPPIKKKGTYFKRVCVCGEGGQEGEPCSMGHASRMCVHVWACVCVRACACLQPCMVPQGNAVRRRHKNECVHVCSARLGSYTLYAACDPLPLTNENSPVGRAPG